MKGYTTKPLSFTRKMVIASLRGNKKNAIHCLSEINVDKPLAFRQEVKDEEGNKLSLTAYLVKCLSSTLKDFPEMNSFISRGRQVIINDSIISVLVEREIDGAKTPEPLAIQSVQEKTIFALHEELVTAKQKTDSLGGLSGAGWIRFIPSFLIPLFIRLANQNIKMALKYGKVAITSVGMYSENASWFIPHGSATVLLTVGGIKDKREVAADGSLENHKYLKLTVSFDHEIIDGAPAARFMNALEKEIASGEAFLNT